MDSNIIERAGNHFDSTTIAEIATHTGETEGYIRGAMYSALPVLMVDMIEKSLNKSGAHKVSSIWEAPDIYLPYARNEGQYDQYLHRTVTGAKILETLYAEKVEHVRNALSSQIGIARHSSMAILSVVAFILAEVMKAQFRDISFAELSSQLSEQKEKAYAAVPRGPLSNLNPTMQEERSVPANGIHSASPYPRLGGLIQWIRQMNIRLL